MISKPEHPILLDSHVCLEARRKIMDGEFWWFWNFQFRQGLLPDFLMLLQTDMDG